VAAEDARAEPGPPEAVQTAEVRARVEEFRRKHRTSLLTMVFTDLVGSTKLIHASAPDARAEMERLAGGAPP
jgi:class 3 adenylate cyclase